MSLGRSIFLLLTYIEEIEDNVKERKILYFFSFEIRITSGSCLKVASKGKKFKEFDEQ